MAALNLPGTDQPVEAARPGTLSERLARAGVLLGLPAPHPLLQACVVVPARNEEAALPSLIGALASQQDREGRAYPAEAYEVILLLNNCSDHTAEVAQAMQARFPKLVLRVAEIDFPAEEAHVGRARQLLFDAASQRLQAVARPFGLILTTDADSRPARDWVAQNELAIAAGVEGVGGRVTIAREEAAALPPGVLRYLLIDIGYRRALEELRSLYVPLAHDPFPRHHQHFGGSLAVTAAAYTRAGGMPLRRSSEDVALYRAVLESGGRFRHSYRVRVETSARMFGRAQGGLADAISWWNCQASQHAPVQVESALAAEARLAKLGLWAEVHPDVLPPPSLDGTPEPPDSCDAAEVHATLGALRVLIAALRPLSLAERLRRARLRFGHHPADWARPDSARP